MPIEKPEKLFGKAASGLLNDIEEGRSSDHHLVKIFSDHAARHAFGHLLDRLGLQELKDAFDNRTHGGDAKLVAALDRLPSQSVKELHSHVNEMLVRVSDRFVGQGAKFSSPYPLHGFSHLAEDFTRWLQRTRHMGLITNKPSDHPFLHSDEEDGPSNNV